jgi:hypothetical protein
MAKTKTKEADQTVTENQTSSEAPLEPKRNRRELLKLAGAAAAGAAGGLALSSMPAAAATGSAMILGVTNDENSTTDLVTTAGASLYTMFRAKASSSTLSTLGIGAITALGNPGAEGVDAWCSGNVGWSVSAAGDSGIALRGSTSTGLDVSAAGTGRIHQTPNIAAGPPAYSPNAQEQVRDSNGVMWISRQAPATTNNGWAPVQPGATYVGTPGTSLFTATTNQQYHLTGSNGSTWVNIDSTNLVLSFTPTFNALGILSANSSLWTDHGGYNQDLGIFVNGVLHSWQENGGTNTFSPNAAFVHGVYGSFLRGTSYTVELRWKTNIADPFTIYAGAGSASTGFSPTRVTVQLVIFG